MFRPSERKETPVKNLRDIMKIVGLKNQADAFRIFERMSMDGLDFSECTKAEFRRAALDAAAEVFGPAVHR